MTPCGRKQVDATFTRQRGAGEAGDVADRRMTEFQKFAAGEMIVHDLCSG